MSYGYDKFGNLASRKDNLRNLEETFHYDKMNRLTDIYLGTTHSQIVYDPLGRMTDKQTDGETVFANAAFAAAQGQPSRPHAMTSAETVEGVFPSSATQEITYTGFDKVKTIAEGGNTLAYTYGYDQQRIRMVENVGDMTRTKDYVGVCEYITEDDGENTTEKTLTYLVGPYGVFAVVEQLNSEESMHYILKDHLGSWTTITDSQGNVEQELSFDAWGNRRNPETWYGPVSSSAAAPMFDRGFTGHEHPYAFGLINMNGRMYDPKTSSFLSVDAYVQSPDNSQSFNRYAYCLNNPLKYTDPTGWQPVGGLRPGNPFHENWGVNFAEKVFTTQDVKQWLWDQGISVGVWMEGDALTGSGCGSGGGSEGDDDKPKDGDKTKQAKGAYNYTNGFATLIGGAAGTVSTDGTDFFGKMSRGTRIIGGVGVLIELIDNLNKYSNGEISAYSFTARTINSGGEFALSFIPYGIGPTLSITVTAIDIAGGFDNNIYNEEWMKGVLNETKKIISPQRSNNETSPIIYYRHGW